MATNTLEQVFQTARGFLHDTTPSSGAVWTDSALQVHFNEPYRKMFNTLMGVSKRVQRIVYVNLPASTTVLVPSTYNITDFGEPEKIEERQAQAQVAIQFTNISTPIICNAPNHGLGQPGDMVEGVVSGVSLSSAPWGRWFATIIDANNFSLNGSATDGVVGGAGGFFTPWSQLPFQEVMPLDLNSQGMDGIPNTYLGVYEWINEQLTFPGATGTQQLRITYWASGNPPTNTNTIINIDNCIDFLSVATAANAARANAWDDMADRLDKKAYGDGGEDSLGGLLGDFVRIQVSTLQRGPQRRREAFRWKKSRYGANYVIT
jgi:hypothetical protein